MKTDKKFIMITINDSQKHLNKGYWPKQFEKWGFKFWKTIGNDWGMNNHMYYRAPLDKTET